VRGASRNRFGNTVGVTVSVTVTPLLPHTQRNQLHFLSAQVILGNRTALLCYPGRACCITSGATTGIGTSPPSAPPTGMDG
jgi:hypothetical protein